MASVLLSCYFIPLRLAEVAALIYPSLSRIPGKVRDISFSIQFELQRNISA